MERIDQMKQFNSWMKKINSNYYANHPRMRAAYERLNLEKTENNKERFYEWIY